MEEEDNKDDEAPSSPMRMHPQDTYLYTGFSNILQFVQGELAPRNLFEKFSNDPFHEKDQNLAKDEPKAKVDVMNEEEKGLDDESGLKKEENYLSFKSNTCYENNVASEEDGVQNSDSYLDLKLGL